MDSNTSFVCIPTGFSSLLGRMPTSPTVHLLVLLTLPFGEVKSFLRGMFSGVNCQLFARQMFTGPGSNNAESLIAAVATLFCIMPFGSGFQIRQVIEGQESIREAECGDERGVWG